jgi:DNA-directed RNA polymerase specialized sigma24 family protein
VVLRCYTDLADAQIAAAMGVSPTEVRDHATQAMSALRAVLEADDGALQTGQGEPG